MTTCDQVKLEKTAAILKALSSPNRLRILMELSALTKQKVGQDQNSQNGKATGEIGLSLDIAPSTVSHHLKELGKAGIIHRKREGRRVVCWLNPELHSELASILPPQKNA